MKALEVKPNIPDRLACEIRANASKRLGKSLAKLDDLNLPLLSDEEIEAEIQAARAERLARHT